MKKFLLSVGFALMATIGGAQVIVYVEAPSANEGNYVHTYAEAASGWGVADLTDPLNSVQGTMVMVDDGTAGDSLACNPLINGAQINGNVAVLYRGSCEFGLKAKNAQDQGAIGVIIINNLGGSPVGMGGGVEGPNVTIPVVMISNTDGALLKAEIEAGTSTVFIGSKNGLYADDIGCTQADLLRAEYFSNLQILSQNASEFEVQVGTWVRNYGSNDQTDVILNVTIDLGATNVYNETSSTYSILSGDSAFIPLPIFSQSSYANGYYEMTYTLQMGATDESSYDNVQEANFFINDSVVSLARINPADGKPMVETAQFHSYDLLETCIHFRNPNASRIAAYGISFAAGTSQNPDPTSLDGSYVQAYVYEWQDVFTDFTDYPDWNSAALNDIAWGEYIYTADGQNEIKYITFDENPILVDDQRYLVCLEFENGVYPGYDTKLDYNWNFETFLQPLNVSRGDGGQYYAAGFGTDRSISATLNFIDATTVNIAELPAENLVGYPNPASEYIQIPMNHRAGAIQLSIVDINGKLISTQNVAMDGTMLTVDVTTLSSGMYVFNMIFEDGTQGSINVAVNR